MLGFRIVRTKKLNKLNEELRDAKYRANNAKNFYFKVWMENSGLIEAAAKEMAYGLSRALGKELEPHARKILESSRNRPEIDFSLHEMPTEKNVETLRGEIPNLCYQIVLW